MLCLAHSRTCRRPRTSESGRNLLTVWQLTTLRGQVAGLAPPIITSRWRGVAYFGLILVKLYF